MRGARGAEHRLRIVDANALHRLSFARVLGGGLDGEPVAIGAGDGELGKALVADDQHRGVGRQDAERLRRVDDRLLHVRVGAEHGELLHFRLDLREGPEALELGVQRRRIGEGKAGLVGDRLARNLAAKF